MAIQSRKRRKPKQPSIEGLQNVDSQALLQVIKDLAANLAGGIQVRVTGLEGTLGRGAWIKEILYVVLGIGLAMSVQFAVGFMESNRQANREDRRHIQFQITCLNQVAQELSEDSSRLELGKGLGGLRTLDASGYRLDNLVLGRFKIQLNLWRPRILTWKRVWETPGLLKGNEQLMDDLIVFYFKLECVTNAIDDLVKVWEENLGPENQGQRAIDLSEVVGAALGSFTKEAESLQAAIPYLQKNLTKEVELLENTLDREKSWWKELVFVDKIVPEREGRSLLR
jgi:hypothetical protein